MNRGIDKANKKIPKTFGSGITLKSNEIDFTIKVIKPAKNGEMLLTGTTEKINSQEGFHSNFLAPLMKVGLLLMENLLTPLPISVLIRVRLTAAASATDATIQKKKKKILD